MNHPGKGHTYWHSLQCFFLIHERREPSPLADDALVAGLELAKHWDRNVEIRGDEKGSRENVDEVNHFPTRVAMGYTRPPRNRHGSGRADGQVLHGGGRHRKRRVRGQELQQWSKILGPRLRVCLTPTSSTGYRRRSRRRRWGLVSGPRCSSCAWSAARGVWQAIQQPFDEQGREYLEFPQCQPAPHLDCYASEPAWCKGIRPRVNY
ncbi:hypothetical protein FB45DRAFT_1153101 [Roridomyces roridus]|uniref:Uncharacterized protein n=1 Tax=Roridomyces roridus TaxID=1738132 RepID=A0AAD7FPZ8_9AGAR|nr:hypothetical protein FB45DRAFT_1153101 [Roridomyces roridus]